MTTTKVHRLVLVDRGEVHRHRWAPECSCGKWVGKFRRRKQEAVEQHRQHATALDRSARAVKTKGLRSYRPRPVTPLADLPEELRPAVL